MGYTPPPATEIEEGQNQALQQTNATTELQNAATSELPEPSEVFVDALDAAPTITMASQTVNQFAPIDLPVDLRKSSQTPEEDATASADSVAQTNGVSSTLVEETPKNEPQEVVETLEQKPTQQTRPMQGESLSNHASLSPLQSETQESTPTTTGAAKAVFGSLLTPALLQRVEGMKQQYTTELSKRIVFNKFRKQDKLAAAEQLIRDSQVRVEEVPTSGSTQTGRLDRVIDNVLRDHPQAMAGFFSKRFKEVIRAARAESGVVLEESVSQSGKESAISV